MFKYVYACRVVLQSTTTSANRHRKELLKYTPAPMDAGAKRVTAMLRFLVQNFQNYSNLNDIRYVSDPSTFANSLKARPLFITARLFNLCP